MANLTKTIDYSKFLDDDIFFSAEKSIIGGAIRIGEKAKSGWDFLNPKTWAAGVDRTMPNHAGFLYSIRGQWFAAEVAGRGITLTSLDKYRTDKNVILHTMRYDQFENVTVREKFMDEMSLWIRRRQDTGYDLWGALSASIGLHKIFPWLKNDKKKEFCSEDVYSWLKKFGAVFPLTWEKHPPNPLQLYQWMKENHHYKSF